MFRARIILVSIVAAVVAASCGSAAPATGSVSDDQTLDSLPAVQPEVSTTDRAAPVTAPSSVATATPPLRLQTTQLDQPAIWPASDIVFDTPEEAAESFVSDVLGVTPVLGDFAAGDSRSGEIQVFSPGESEAPAPEDLLERGLLALRIIGPDDGWFVIGAGSAGVVIESPATLASVPAGPLAVEGSGRGFEGTVVVTAFRAGDADDVIDQVIARGGAFEALEPFDVTLDLSATAPGDVIALIVRGDTGLDGDPGDFASIPIVIGEPLPETG